MKKTGIGMLVIAIALSIFAAVPVSAQEAGAKSDIEDLKKTAPKIFIDCGDCDIDYIRTEITFVNYVRDRKEAQVHVLITTLRTGSGGHEYTLSFTGQNEFAGLDDTQQYYSNKTDTEDEIRSGMVNTLKMGLMGYVARTPIAGRVSIDYQQEEKPKAAVEKWKSWVFSLSGSGYFSGETSMNSRSLDASFSASRITPDIKIALSLSAEYEKDHFVYEDETIDSLSKGLEFEGLVVKSLGDHWSAGAYVSAESSTYQNLESAVNFAPAIEFDLFPIPSRPGGSSVSFTSSASRPSATRRSPSSTSSGRIFGTSPWRQRSRSRRNGDRSARRSKGRTISTTSARTAWISSPSSSSNSSRDSAPISLEADRGSAISCPWSREAPRSTRSSCAAGSFGRTTITSSPWA